MSFSCLCSHISVLYIPLVPKALHCNQRDRWHPHMPILLGPRLIVVRDLGSGWLVVRVCPTVSLEMNHLVLPQALIWSGSWRFGLFSQPDFICDYPEVPFVFCNSFWFHFWMLSMLRYLTHVFLAELILMLWFLPTGSGKFWSLILLFGLSLVLHLYSCHWFQLTP